MTPPQKQGGFMLAKLIFLMDRMGLGHLPLYSLPSANRITLRRPLPLLLLQIVAMHFLQSKKPLSSSPRLPKRKHPFTMGVFFLADRTGLEPATSRVTGERSNQLSYRSYSY